MSQFLGRHGNALIYKCCPLGKWQIEVPMRGSGNIICKHENTDVHYDFLDLNTLSEVTDENIIKEALENYKEEGIVKFKPPKNKISI